RLADRSVVAGRFLLRAQRTRSDVARYPPAVAQSRRARHARDRTAALGAGGPAARLGQAAGDASAFRQGTRHPLFALALAAHHAAATPGDRGRLGAGYPPAVAGRA